MKSVPTEVASYDAVIGSPAVAVAIGDSMHTEGTSLAVARTPAAIEQVRSCEYFIVVSTVVSIIGC
jgi:hypothetical protein